MKKLCFVLLVLFLLTSCTELVNDTTKLSGGYIITRYEFEAGTCDVALKTYKRGNGGLVGVFKCWTPKYPEYIITGDIDIFPRNDLKLATGLNFIQSGSSFIPQSP